MNRPGINPANIRRQSTPAKVACTIARFLFWIALAVLAALVYVHIFDPALNPYL